MTNFIARASQWISAYREQHASETILITTNSLPGGVEVAATIVGNTGETNPSGVQVQTQHVRFIVKRSTLAAKGIRLSRDIHITWQNRLYMISIDKLNEWEYNDPDCQDVILKTIYKQDLSGKPQ